MQSGEVLLVLSGAVVWIFAGYLIALAVVAAIKPSLVKRFFALFASSARTHYIEQGARLLVGAAMVNLAQQTLHPELFQLFGWVLVLTSVGLLMIPWQWHREFAKWAIPLAIRHLRFVALGAFTLGSLLLYGVCQPLLT